LFREIIKDHPEFGINTSVNIGCDSKCYADIEYLTNSGEYLIVEAKSHESKDAFNTRHKIFGQLLKEHGKTNDHRSRHSNCLTLGILIPEDPPSSGKSNTTKPGIVFYREGYEGIPEHLYSAFGSLVKAKYVFVCSVVRSSVKVFTWVGYYRGDAEICLIRRGA
jgi:hypothetical protein